MNTSDESKLFQTDAQLAHKEARARKAVLTKTIGRPIQLPSRAIKLKVRGQDAWVAESGWVVRRICLHVSLRGWGGNWGILIEATGAQG